MEAGREKMLQFAHINKCTFTSSHVASALQEKGLGDVGDLLKDDFSKRSFQKSDGMFIKWGLTESLGGVQFSGKN